MGKTESSHLPLIWASSASYGKGAESEGLTSIYHFDEQSARITRDKLKYVHVNFGFHNKRKLGKVLFEEGISFQDRVMTRIINGEVQYAS